MFQWLRGPSPIDIAIDEGEYPEAMKLIQAEIDRDRRPEKTRPLRQTMADVPIALQNLAISMPTAPSPWWMRFGRYISWQTNRHRPQLLSCGRPIWTPTT